MKILQRSSVVLLIPTVAMMALLSQTDVAVAKSRTVSDGSIADAVEDELLFDPIVPFNKVDATVSDGIVTLSGQVPSLLAKDRAARIAETVKGVRAVVNQLRVDMGQDRTAAAIRSDVTAALLSDPATESYEITVTSTGDGEVTLSGTVDSWQERQLAGKVTKRVRGVTALNNEIEVDYVTTRRDEEIQREIESALRWDLLVDHAMIDVAVNNGKVKLRGTVGSAAEKTEAVTDAWVAGVTDVDAAGLNVKKWARDVSLRTDKFVVASDKEVRKAIEDALMYDPRVMSFNVTPHVDNGIVTLRGSVDNLKAKRAAAEDARNTVGVLAVKNRIKVRPTEGIADAAIEAKVQKAIKRDPYADRHEITVNVMDGVAHLYGEVDTLFEKAQADDVASRVNGVVAVRNHLAVDYLNEPLTYDPYIDDWYVYDYDWYQYRPWYSHKLDGEIRADIKNELWWSPFVDADDVTVAVEDGVATLTGQVESLSERRAATENAYEGGATWVDNELVVQ